MGALGAAAALVFALQGKLPEALIGIAHGVFAPNSKLRVRVTPAKRGRGRKRRQPTGENWIDKTPSERHQSMTWLQRLKRVFNIDIETCERCAGQVKIIAEASDRCIEERVSHHRGNREDSVASEGQRALRRVGDVV